MAEHGTYARAMEHQKAREVKCGPCREAAAAYMREFRKNPTNRKRAKEMSKATSRALNDLSRMHKADYEALYADHLGKIRGLW